MNSPVSKLFATGGVLCLVAAPLFMAAQSLVTPLHPTDDAAHQVADALGHQHAMVWAAVLDVGFVFLYPAVLYLGHLAGARTTKLGFVATAVTFVPMLPATVLLAGDGLVYEASRQPDRAAAVRLVDDYVTSPLFSVITIAYLALHVVGFVLLAVALRRAGVVPTWSAVCLGGWSVLEMVGSGAGLEPLTLAAYAALLAGSWACCTALLRETQAGAAAEPRVGVLAAS